MKNILIQLHVNNENDIDEIRGLLAEQARLSLLEPGCHRFEVLHSQGDRTTFFLIEQWESPEAHEVHRTAQAYTEIYQPRILPRVERIAHVSDIVS
jgi:quinol monooxygenase YgiN